MPVTILDAGISIPRLPRKDGGTKTSERAKAALKRQLAGRVETFYNKCNLPESGEFGPKGACGTAPAHPDSLLPQRGGRYQDVAPAIRGGRRYGTPEHKAVIDAKKGSPRSKRGSAEEIAAAQALADLKTRKAPVPSKDKVIKGRREIILAKQGNLRAGGENRGNVYDRRNSRLNLFDEFGGFSRGYVVDPQIGLKMHWADPRPQIPDSNGVLRDNPDHIFNPLGYPPFERGKVFTHSQGGGYQQPNLIAESFSSNRARGDTPVRKENRQTNKRLGLAFSISEQARTVLKSQLVAKVELASQGNPEALISYWRDGEGAARIAWGTPSDFTRCLKLVGKYVDQEIAGGFCQNRHIEIFGESNAARDKRLDQEGKK